jgi:hypothetical protein
VPRRIEIAGSAHVLVDGDRGTTVYDGRSTRVVVVLDAGPSVEYWHSIGPEQYSRTSDGSVVFSAAVFREAGPGPVELRLDVQPDGAVTSVGWRTGRPSGQ